MRAKHALILYRYSVTSALTGNRSDDGGLQETGFPKPRAREDLLAAQTPKSNFKLCGHTEFFSDTFPVR